MKSVKDLEVSMDNLKAWVEAGLRSLGGTKGIPDKNIELLTFAIAPLGMTVQEWEAQKTVKIQIKLKNREVQVIDFG